MNTNNTYQMKLSKTKVYQMKRNPNIYLSPHFLASACWKIVRTAIIMGLCFLILYPFLMKIINSFKGFDDFIDPTVKFIPKNVTMKNILVCIQRMHYFKALGNTTVICLVVAVLQTTISAVIGYGFARFKFKGNHLLFFFVVFTLIVPPQTIIIPLFMKFRFFVGFINLIDTPYPMIVLSLTGLGLKNGLYIFIFRQFFKNMPHELEEAAYIDGYNTFQTFVKIMLPSAVATMTTVFLLSFSWQWTDVLYNNLFFKDFTMLSNVILLAGASEVPIMKTTLQNTASMLAVLPLAVLYIFAQKGFVQSVERSGIVG